MYTTYSTKMMDNRPNANRQKATLFSRAISIFKIFESESPSSIDAARMAQIARNSRPMVDIGPIIRNR